MYTSYYAQLDSLIQQGYKNFVAISGWLPEFYQELLLNNTYKDISFRKYQELSPKKEWFFKWKNGEFDNNQYINLYYETVLSKLNPEIVYEDLKEDAILLCYEKPDDFCHRHLVAEWLNKNLKINVKEIECNTNYFIF
jgi:hypothetical protein